MINDKMPAIQFVCQKSTGHWSAETTKQAHTPLPVPSAIVLPPSDDGVGVLLPYVYVGFRAPAGHIVHVR